MYTVCNHTAGNGEGVRCRWVFAVGVAPAVSLEGVPMKSRRSFAAGLLLATCLPALAQPSENTLVVAQSVDVESLEPDMLNQASSLNVAMALWGTLLSVTPEGEIVPNFAESYF